MSASTARDVRRMDRRLFFVLGSPIATRPPLRVSVRLGLPHLHGLFAFKPQHLPSTVILTWVCVQADLGRCLTRQVLRAVEGLFIGYNDV